MTAFLLVCSYSGKLSAWQGNFGTLACSTSLYLTDELEVEFKGAIPVAQITA